MLQNGFLVLESGKVFSGLWKGGSPKAGEVVFNTSHSGYEEMATDPSYFSQILVTTAPMQGNYGVQDESWESNQIHIRGFISLEIQDSERDRSWLERLTHKQIPVISEIDTRALVTYLRSAGTVWGAMLQAQTEEQAIDGAKSLISQAKNKDKDWAHLVSVKEASAFKGAMPKGPRVAVIDFGSKMNIIRELQKRCSEVCLFPSRTSFNEIKAWNPDGIMLSNGPGDPEDVLVAKETVKELLGQIPIFGICMGHQILSRALGFETYKLKFGHRGSNHPIKDDLLERVYMTAQNHGYAVKLNEKNQGDIKITHTNLNDNTVAGLFSRKLKCLSVQFHPESHPGPHEAESLFDFFINEMVVTND